MTTGTDPRRRLPAIDELLAEPRVAPLVELYGRAETTIQARRELESLRAEARSDPAGLDAALAALPEILSRGLERRLGRPVRRVLNATGVLLHTNLGRAPLPRDLPAELEPLLSASCDLEVDLRTGRRGDRNLRIERLLVAATGAEAALVVNNNAAALFLLLRVLARGAEVVVSRGELVEIGGSFRIPDILVEAGARLVEVGTTNRTRPADYERAIGPETALLLKVHPSNYRQSGFVASVGAAELARIGRSRGVPVLVDEGAGLLREDERAPLAGHPSFRELVAAGCDLVCGSGDKVLGGPQAGLVVGRADLVRACRRHPLYRCLRPGRFTLTALEAVLRRHSRGAPRPLDRLFPHEAELVARLEPLREVLGGEILPAEAFLGGGAGAEVPVVGPAVARADDGGLAARLRDGDPAVMGRLGEGRLWLDLRTVDPRDDGELLEAVRRALAADGS